VNDPPSLRLKVAIASVGVIYILVTVSVGATRFGLTLLIFLLVLWGPYLLYLTLIATRLGAAVVGLAMLAITLSLHTAFFFSGSSSTAGLAFVSAGLLTYMAVFLGAGIERIGIRASHRRSTGSSR